MDWRKGNLVRVKPLLTPVIHVEFADDVSSTLDMDDFLRGTQWSVDWIVPESYVVDCDGLSFAYKGDLDAWFSGDLVRAAVDMEYAKALRHLEEEYDRQRS